MKKNIIFITPAEGKRRRDICNTCEHKKRKFNVARCELCGCIILGKTNVSAAKCPIGKW